MPVNIEKALSPGALRGMVSPNPINECSSPSYIISICRMLYISGSGRGNRVWATYLAMKYMHIESISSHNEKSVADMHACVNFNRNVNNVTTSFSAEDVGCGVVGGKRL